MKPKQLNRFELIAPCGICRAYLREKNKCSGCRGLTEKHPGSRWTCKIKICDRLKSKFCFDCEAYPCRNLKHLDKRYRTRYNMSMIENLDHIKKVGIRAFVKNEKARWACSKCGETVCVHSGQCSCCNNEH